MDQYNFLDIDDIEEFNGYLYQDKRTSKEKARMWALLDKSLRIINRHPELEKLEMRLSILIFLISVSQYILLCAQQNVRHPRNIKAA